MDLAPPAAARRRLPRPAPRLRGTGRHAPAGEKATAGRRTWSTEYDKAMKSKDPTARVAAVVALGMRRAS
jgi:hypothetical protein